MARLQGAWLQGQWQPLIVLTPEQIRTHPQRTRLACYAAGSHAALDSTPSAHSWLEQAAAWEPDRARRHRILIGCLGQRQGRSPATDTVASAWAATLQRGNALSASS